MNFKIGDRVVCYTDVLPRHQDKIGHITCIRPIGLHQAESADVQLEDGGYCNYYTYKLIPKVLFNSKLFQALIDDTKS